MLLLTNMKSYLDDGLKNVLEGVGCLRHAAHRRLPGSVQSAPECIRTGTDGAGRSAGLVCSGRLPHACGAIRSARPAWHGAMRRKREAQEPALRIEPLHRALGGKRLAAQRLLLPEAAGGQLGKAGIEPVFRGQFDRRDAL